MTTLLIQTENSPLMVNFPAIDHMTAAQFHEFCQANQDLRIERTAQGKVIAMPPTAADTGNRNLNIAAQLWNWAEQDGTGICFDSSAGFTLPNGAIRSPDDAWIKLERWNTLTPEQQASFAPLAPDFVVELCSASDTLISLQEKMQEYLDNGVALGWLIDRQNRLVHIYRSQQSPEILQDPEFVLGAPELSGFRLGMMKVW